MPTFIIDGDHRVTFWNKACEILTGLSSEDIQGTKDHWKAFYKKQRPTMADVIVNHLTEAEIEKIYHKKYHKSSLIKGAYEAEDFFPDLGETGKWLYFTASPLKDREGKVIGAIETIRDITDSKKVDEALRQSENLLRRVIETASCCIFVKDKQGKYVLANKFMAELHHTTPQNMIGKTDLDFSKEKITTQEEADKFFRDDREVIEYQKDKIALEEPFSMQDGSTRWFYTHKAPLKISGDRDCVLGVAIDVTKRHIAEEKVKEAEKRFRSYIEHAPYGIFVTNGKGDYIDVNPGATVITGYSREELLNMKILDFIPEEFREQAEKHFEKVLNTGTATTDIPFIKKDGSRSFWTVKATKISENRFLGFVNDISELKKAEEEKRRLEEQYRQAQKMEAIGQLTGGVAHDFNNLLQVICGCADMALEDIEVSHPVRETLEDINQAGSKAARLVKQLLIFSRRQVMRPEILDMNEVIPGLLKMVDRVIGEHIQLKWLPGEKLGKIFADRGMIEQALMNLCVNARDAMPDGGTLTIQTKETMINSEFCFENFNSKPGIYVELQVSDTGAGMNKETLKHIFEPFFTTKEQGKGTGLGLSTVYGIVKQHDGMINANSEPGKGTTLKLYWPITKSQKKIKRTSEEENIKGGPETILLAEDEEIVRNLARTVLEREGYIVITAENGLEAINKFEQAPEEIDMAMLDVVMPEMGGYQAFKKMRTLRPEMKALFSSGYSEDAVHTDFVLNEGLTLIQKPYSRKKLLSLIRKILDE